MAVIVLAIAINLMLSMTIFQIFDRPARNLLRHAVAFKRRRWRAAMDSVFAILATFVFAIPILIMIATRGDHLALVHEALTFCYFATIRILNGEGGEIWLPHGQIITVLQQMLVLALHYAVGWSFVDLKPMIYANEYRHGSPVRMRHPRGRI
jgi:hypothetical protein